MEDTSNYLFEQAGPTPWDYGRRHYRRHWNRALRAARGDVRRAASSLARAGRLLPGPVGLQLGSSSILWLNRYPAVALILLSHGGGWWLRVRDGRVVGVRIPWDPKFRNERPTYFEGDFVLLDRRQWEFEQRHKQRRSRRHAHLAIAA